MLADRYWDISYIPGKIALSVLPSEYASVYDGLRVISYSCSSPSVEHKIQIKYNGKKVDIKDIYFVRKGWWIFKNKHCFVALAATQGSKEDLNVNCSDMKLAPCFDAD